MTALLEDTYATASAVPWRARMGLARSGLAERARGNGLWRDRRSGPGRAGARRLVLVLCGWALFVVAGAIFAKFADSWSATAPNRGALGRQRRPTTPSPSSPRSGCALVAVAALLAVPSLARLIRDGRWESVRRPMRRAVVAGGVAVVLFGARSPGPTTSARTTETAVCPLYSALFVVLGLASVAAVLCATAAAVSIARRVRAPRPVVRVAGAGHLR